MLLTQSPEAAAAEFFEITPAGAAARGTRVPSLHQYVSRSSAQRAGGNSLFHPSISHDWHALPRLNVGVFYEFSTNRSIGEGARPFDRNRAGVMASYSF